MVLHDIMNNMINERPPKDYLHEHASNLSWILIEFPEVREKVNSILSSIARTKVLPSTSGISIEIDNIAISQHLTSDTVLRILYYIEAIYSNVKFAEVHKLTPIVMLEEPESHMSPLPFNDIVNIFNEAKEKYNIHDQYT